MKLFYSVLAAIGALAATVGTQGCLYFLLDEPEMPRGLLDK